MAFILSTVSREHPYGHYTRGHILGTLNTHCSFFSLYHGLSARQDPFRNNVPSILLQARQARSERRSTQTTVKISWESKSWQDFRVDWSLSWNVVARILSINLAQYKKTNLYRSSCNDQIVRPCTFIIYRSVHVCHRGIDFGFLLQDNMSNQHRD